LTSPIVTAGTSAGEAQSDGSSNASCGSRDQNRFAAEIEEITAG
jgi:hypothetical protein